mmetsp:Transcript_24219/g.37762  ORF Transcript_24219/g.37762 Transcript_24219/m.37762 type:complete len:113 (+) Transcript_24219:23-361(+)
MDTPDDQPQLSTVYITNITNKIPPEDIKRNLYDWCTLFGTVLEVMYSRMNGHSHAFVVFPDTATAHTAIEALNGATFMDRPLHVELSHTPSDRLMHSQGKNLKSKYIVQRGG